MARSPAYFLGRGQLWVLAAPRQPLRGHDATVILIRRNPESSPASAHLWCFFPYSRVWCSAGRRPRVRGDRGEPGRGPGWNDSGDERKQCECVGFRQESPCCRSPGYSHSLRAVTRLIPCWSRRRPATATPFGEVDVGGAAARRVTITQHLDEPSDFHRGEHVGSGAGHLRRRAPVDDRAGRHRQLVGRARAHHQRRRLWNGRVPRGRPDGSSRGFPGHRQRRPANKLASSAATASFGDVTLGTTAKQDVTLTNGGTTSVSIASMIVSAAGVTATGMPLPATFAPGESATVTLTYAPTAVGPVSGSVAVKSEQGSARVGRRYLRKRGFARACT